MATWQNNRTAEMEIVSNTQHFINNYIPTSKTRHSFKLNGMDFRQLSLTVLQFLLFNLIFQEEYTFTPILNDQE